MNVRKYIVKKISSHWTVNGKKHGKVGNSIFNMNQFLRIGFESGTINHYRKGHEKRVNSGCVVELSTEKVNGLQGIRYTCSIPAYNLALQRYHPTPSGSSTQER